jgi:hypothetical protein
MKLKSTALIAMATLFLISCSSKKNATIPAADEIVAIVQHPVANYDNWKPFFDGDDSSRKAYGLTTIGIGRGIDDPNQVILFFRVTDTTKSSQFMNRPELKDLMQKAGVTAPPTLDVVHTIRNDTSKTDIQDRLLVKHKVKDFDAWLKVYDKEGMETRKDNGMIDRALARGTADPNMVYILFAISDWTKANARFQSDDLKKIMQDAGVEGAPTVVKYKFQSQ